MNTYRILTNGKTYRVQVLRLHRVLWIRWKTWEFLMCVYLTKDETPQFREWKSRQEARSWLNERIAKERLDSEPWIQVS